MTILITGATGGLGHLVVDALIARGTDPASIRAGARDIAKAADLQARGVEVVRLDYDDAASVTAAVHGADAVLLISGAPGGRVRQHRTVIDAAAVAGVERFVYTSAPRATTTSFVLAADHRATEEAIAAAGLPAVILRNGWYVENYLDDVRRAADTGVIAASVGDGRVAAAARADYAEAAAVVLTEPGHIGAVYELGGDTAVDYAEIAAAAAEVTGRPIRYVPLTAAEHIAALRDAGLDEGTAAFVAAIDTGIGEGAIAAVTGDLHTLLGRAPVGFADALRSAL